MTKKEYADRNIGMSFDFIRQIIDQPEIVDTIPDSAELDFMDKYFPIKAKAQPRRKKVARYKVEQVFVPIKSQFSL